MRDGHTNRVCPSCGAVGTVERVTCDHCGTLTESLKVTRAREQPAVQRDGQSHAPLAAA